MMESSATDNKYRPQAAGRKRPGSIPLLEADYHSAEQHYSDEVDEATVVRSTRVVWIFSC
ncbi:hypothetical protein [Microbulbifer taiwanensis]|uniref:hypothetical protein n=1 Tax=Microbulbifer taiwanensis TaxID=986746 RepID=UPI0036114D53